MGTQGQISEKGPSPKRSWRSFSLTRVTIVSLILTLLLLSTTSFYHQILFSLRGDGKKLQALHTATELRFAILNYYAVYKTLPIPETPSSEDIIVDTSAGSGVIGKLIGDNPRGFLFLSEKSATNKKLDGFLYVDGEDISTAELLDPWGQPYQIIMDASDDMRITVPNRDRSETTGTISKLAAVWSTGPDQRTGGSKNDDIYVY